MVKSDLGRNCQNRIQNVGCIKSAAKSGFYDGDIYFTSLKMIKRKSGYQLKKRKFFFTRVARCRSMNEITALFGISSLFTLTLSRKLTR